jgi:hypothetical protein
LWAYFPAVQENAMGANAVRNSGRMHRLTLYNNDPTAGLTTAQKALRPMSYLQADKAFRIEDELKYVRPENDNTLPAAQLFTPMVDSNNNPFPGRRQEEGRLTWFATLVPKADRLNTQLGEEYVLSIVVCLNRSGEATHVPDPAANDHPYNEWSAKILAANYHASGIGGGEVTITTNAAADNPFANTNNANHLSHQDQLNALRSGSWVLLGTRAPWWGTAANPTRVLQVFQWYRVSDAGEEAYQNPTDNTRYDRDVTLIGPDWPVDVTGDGTNDECDVIIVPHVVHVYERTIKIDTGAQ